MFQILILALPTLLLIAALVMVCNSDESQLNETERKFVARVKDLYLSVKNPVHARKEKELKIAEMYVYPIRGIRVQGEVDYFDIGPYGIKYDREIILAKRKEKWLLTTE